jgi:hypothetical protein
MIRQLSAVAVSTLVLAAVPAMAQESLFRNVDAQPGKTQRLAVAANVAPDCKPGTPPEIKVLQPPKNGNLAVRSGETPAGQLKRCPGLKVPVQGVFYQAKAGFAGVDEVVFEIRRPDGKVQSHSVRITVSDKPAATPKPDPKADAVDL